MKNYLKALSFAAFSLFVLGCLLELLALLGLNSLALLGATDSDDGRWLLLFGIPFFIFWLTMFVLQFRSPYREAMQKAAVFRVDWISAVIVACILGWFAGGAWMVKYWDGGGPEIHNGHYTLWLKGLDQYLPLTAADFTHNMAIFSRFMMAWVIAAFLSLWEYFKQMAHAGSASAIDPPN